MWKYLWPILLVIGSNTIYHIISKSTPKNVHPFITLTLTYTVAAIASLVFFFLSRGDSHVLTELKKTNWTSFALGVAVIGLEFGYLQVYRAGWNISVGSLVANIGLAIMLLVVGIFLYKESVTINQLIGIALCMLGIVFIKR
jgi:EamA-like transporter family.